MQETEWNELDEENEEGKAGKKRLRKSSALRNVIDLFIYALIVLSLTYLIVTYVGQRTRVDGNSMYNTLYNGDNLLVDKLTYRFTDPERFDIVVFKYLYKEDCYYIKRVIGLPGETVQIIGDDIYINGEVLEEDYGLEPIADAKRAASPITLGENEYFVMGDNRNDSSDSRDPTVGNVKRSQIIGKAFMRIWPFSRFGLLKHQ